MQTNFSEDQLKDKDNQSTEKIFQKCVHCGMCNATCPTYGILGDELDGPRGRIYLIQDMLENERKPSKKVVKHIDRCLSCYSCMTTCPAGVNYMHVIDHGRKYIEKNYDHTKKKIFKFNDLDHEGSFLAFRIEGDKRSIDERLKELKIELDLSNFKSSILDGHQSIPFWKKVNNLELFSGTKNNILRAVMPPAKCETFSKFLNKNYDHTKKKIFKFNDLDHEGSFVACRIEGDTRAIDERLKELKIE